MASAASIRDGFAIAKSEGPISIDSPLGAAIAFRSADAVEALSQLFRYDLVVVSPRADLRGRDLLGQSVTVHLQRDDNDSIRHFNGRVASFEYLTTGDDDLSHYRIVLRPWLWQLTKTADCRIFQHESVPEIVASVFRDRGFDAFENKLFESYARREYVVQYRETDFHFVSRLMEQEGIYYFFEHADGRHTMVLADSPSAHGPAPGCETIPFAPPDAHRDATTQYVHRWRSQTEIETAQFAHADYEFRMPRARLYARREAPDLDAADSLEVYDYPGNFTTSADAARYADLRLAQIRAGAEVSTGETNDRGLRVGSTFTLTDHPRDDENKEYLVVSAQWRLRGHEIRSRGEAEEDTFASEFGVIAAKTTFRTAVGTPKPVVQGPQTAMVVGPAGQEIWTDEYGRIKVQFHWDRLGQRDENSSCFVRVAQSWAGGGWGAQFIPRIGQEVVVDFLEGDPDRPIVTGSVYNAANMPAFSLPENATQSGIRTRSSKGGVIPNANEIRFEDRKGGEELYLQAEKDMNTLVKNDQTLNVGANRAVTVVQNQSLTVGMNDMASVRMNRSVSVMLDQTVAVGANSVEAIGGSLRTTVGAERVETIGSSATSAVGNDFVVQVGGATRFDLASTLNVSAGGDESHTTGGALDVRVGGDASYVYAAQSKSVVGHPDREGAQDLFVYGTSSTQASKDVVLESDTSLTLKCANTTIVITPDGITVNGKTLALNAGSKLAVISPNASLTVDDNVTAVGKQITASSSGAKLALASDAQLLGSQVKLGSGSGSSASSSANDKDADTKKKPVYIRVKVLRNGKPAAGIAYKLVLDGVTTLSGSTTGAGLVEQKVPATVSAAVLTFLDTGETRTLTIGKIEPVDTLLGAQHRLGRLGFYHGSPDGVLGPLMAHALQAFQNANGLTTSGELDSATQDALKKAYGS
jgi:type VI secretion system secreted protein VgrG